MSTCTIENYGNYVTADPKPLWYTSERYDYCEPFVSESVFQKAPKKSASLIQLFLSALV